MFNAHLERWGLTPDGEAIITSTSRLLPVRANGLLAMLKIAVLDEERRGNRLMVWWEGHGAARVLAAAEDAISHGTRRKRDLSRRACSQRSG
jgi:streptomycin 6-kinase